MAEVVHDHPAGTLVTFTQGAYSDYGIIGHFVTLKPLTLDDMRAAAKRGAESEGEEWDDPSDLAYSRLIPELIREGFLLNLNVTEIYLGDYRLERHFWP